MAAYRPVDRQPDLDAPARYRQEAAGRTLGSGATAGEGAQNLLCAYRAAAVLVGLLANTAFGWWWLDPVVGLGIAGLAIWEGIEAWRGQDCC